MANKKVIIDNPTAIIISSERKLKIKKNTIATNAGKTMIYNENHKIFHKDSVAFTILSCEFSDPLDFNI